MFSSAMPSIGDPTESPPLLLKRFHTSGTVSELTMTPSSDKDFGTIHVQQLQRDRPAAGTLLVRPHPDR